MITPPTEPNPGERISASWMRNLVRYVRAITPVSGPGVKVVRTPNGTMLSADQPRPSKAISKVQETPPYTIRHVVQNETDVDGTIPYTGWEIYLPQGCMSVGGPCTPLNPPATRTSSGSTVTVTDWYRFNTPARTAGQSGSFTVTAHAKISAALTGTDTIYTAPKRYLWVESHDRQPSGSPNTAGDVFSLFVGFIGDGNTPSIDQYAKSNISMTGEANREFELLWFFSVTDLTLSLDDLYLRNQSVTAAGVTFASVTTRSIPTNAVSVYLRIDTASVPYSPSIVTFTSETHQNDGFNIASQVAAVMSPADIYVEIYGLASGNVTLDNRSALNSIQIYKP